TKDFGHVRGIFDVSVEVDEGEGFGFLGPNGAGKTTLIRHLMGFTRPQSGTAEIDGMDCYRYAALLQKRIGYLPGEIALPVGVTGTEFLHMLIKMRGVKDERYLKELLERFDLDAAQDTKRMSLGVKRKVAVVAAFLHDPEILILDEPTSGLDPVMQENFISFVKEQKAKGKTIFMSSHIFHEVDACCDRIAIIRDGHVVSTFRAETLRDTKDCIYRVTFRTPEDMDRFLSLPYSFTSVNREKLRVRVEVTANAVPHFANDLASFSVADFVEIPYTLEDYFMSFYKEDHHFAEVKA
ncbi:MAG: ABC transporter ATP-binding protein, partial [Clostridia bacterium]|nr:ABC transporter ATP-binding protein [Clostridia bacterium]